MKKNVYLLSNQHSIQLLNINPELIMEDELIRNKKMGILRT